MYTASTANPRYNLQVDSCERFVTELRETTYYPTNPRGTLPGAPSILGGLSLTQYEYLLSQSSARGSAFDQVSGLPPVSLIKLPFAVVFDAQRKTSCLLAMAYTPLRWGSLHFCGMRSVPGRTATQPQAARPPGVPRARAGQVNGQALRPHAARRGRGERCPGKDVNGERVHAPLEADYLKIRTCRAMQALL